MPYDPWYNKWVSICLSVQFLIWYWSILAFSNARKTLHISTNLVIFLCVKIFKHSNHMTIYRLWVQIYEILIFYEKKAYFMGILKIWDPIINCMTIALRIISNIKNIVALAYFLVNTFKIGFILFFNKMRYFLTCIIFNSFKRIQIHICIIIINGWA